MNIEAPKGKKNEYLVQVQIVEVREISPKDGGSADPFVKITVGNLPPQVTSTKEKTTTAVFNQNFTFSPLKMNDIDFENFEIKVDVYDQNQFAFNNLIGGHSIGLSTLYRNAGHEIYNKWLPLLHPSSDLKPLGYLLCSMYIIGQADKAPVHDANENQVQDEPDEFKDIPDDQLNPEQLERRRAKKKQVAFVKAPQLETRSFQLMVNIIKAEDLPIMTGETCDPFVAVRANGITLKTATFKNKIKPQFKTRLLFPIQTPLNNDRIVIRFWDKRVCLSDTFVAQVPETPTENDFFNINFLQSRGGVLPYSWFSMYGIPMDERPSDFESNFLGYKKMSQGTAYMGKVLLSLNLTPSEKPETGVVPQSVYREPDITSFAIRLDVYEVAEVKNCGEWIFVRVRVGGQFVDSNKMFPKKIKNKFKNPAKLKDEKKEENKQDSEVVTYVMKEKEIMVPLAIIDLPIDPLQHPDVIIELYNDQKKRQAYLRIPATSHELSDDKPQWYHLKAVKFKGGDDMPEPTHSYILCNVMLKQDSIIQALPRIPIKRSIKTPHMFTCYFYAAYELCPDLFQEDILCTFTLKFGDFDYTLEKPIVGKNPIWNSKIWSTISLDENLQFASNILISFNNSHPSQQGKWFGDTKIGEIVIQAFHIESDLEYDPGNLLKPQWAFYHIIKNGHSIGRILGSFHAQKMNKNQKKRKYYQGLGCNECLDPYLRCKRFTLQAKSKLLSKLIKQQSIINVRIPLPSDLVKEEDKQQKQVQGEEVEQKPKIMDNPYYCSKSVPSRTIGGESETQYSPGYTDPNFQQMIELEFYRPPDLLLLPLLEIEVRSQSTSSSQGRYICFIPLLSFFNKKVDKGIDKIEVKKTLEIFLRSQDFRSQDDDLRIQLEMRNPKVKKEGNDIKNDEEGEKPEKIEEVPKNIFSRKDDKKKQEEEKEKEQKENEDQKKSLAKPLQKALAQKTPSTVIDFDLKLKGIVNVLVDQSYSIDVADEDKDQEKNYTDWQVTELKNLITQLPKNAQGFEVATSYIKRQIQQLTSYKVEEKRFLGLEVQNDDGGETFDYGRAVIKVPYEEIINKNLGYTKFSLYSLGPYGHGELTQAVLKANIKITRINKSTKTSLPSELQVMIDNRNNGYPFTFFNPFFLEFFNKKAFIVKIRVYIYRCLSLAAQSEEIETKHKMAGLTAVCSANAFIEIQVGDGDTGEFIKRVYDQTGAVENTLSPTFLRVYELDGELPTDWKMQLRVMNKGMLSNSLIGCLQIDLEDRLLGEPKLKERMSYLIYRDFYEKQLEKNKNNYSKEAEALKAKLQSEIINLTQLVDQFDRDFKSIPVEYKDLKNLSKSLTSQGTIEMFVECLPFDISRIVLPQPLSEPPVMEYEVRMVIYETMDIAKPEGKQIISIMVEAVMDGSATGTGKEERLETDVHNGSENGWGIFNWRMKFNFKTPCQFPRLKVGVYNFSAFGTNENIGDATISLRRIMNTLKQDSQYIMPPTMFPISHPNFPNQDRGSILLAINILQKVAADGNPVGQGRDEPNQDPFLPTPTEGRGLGDFLKGISFIPWSFIINTVLKILIPMVISALIGFICFVKPGILMPKQP